MPASVRCARDTDAGELQDRIKPAHFQAIPAASNCGEGQKSVMNSYSAQFDPIFTNWDILCPGSHAHEAPLKGFSEALQTAINRRFPPLIGSPMKNRPTGPAAAKRPRSTNKWPITLDTPAKRQIFGDPMETPRFPPFLCHAVPESPTKSRPTSTLFPCVI